MAVLMDTLSIFEQFRDVLGEEKAKVFAHTLGTMLDEAKNAATKEDIRELRESLDSNVARFDAALATLAENLAALAAQVDTLAENLATLTLRVNKLTEAVDKLVIRSDRHEGTLLELKFRDRLPNTSCDTALGPPSRWSASR
jgi:chromosome segregation ATPase